MIKTYYHGTSVDNLEKILKEGLYGDTDKLWSCSRSEVYMWDVEALAKVDGNEEDLQEWKERAAYSRASEAGQIACTVAKDCRVVVLKIRMNDKNVYVDTSCNNMGGAVATDKVLPKQIQEVYVSNDLSLVKGFMMMSIADMDLWAGQFTDMEWMVIKILQKCEWYPENMDEIIRWTQVKASKVYAE